ncbi:MAG: penicillin-binding transpeptidase domain-containing protein [Bdellovibrionota bacterium]|nr:penicillin-binding transpeptidase domain-containing protein [Bdellovibrionota bacterium]
MKFFIQSILFTLLPIELLIAKEIFLYIDHKNAKIGGYNLAQKNIRHSPCSTFKIPNTIFGLEHGVLKNKKSSLNYEPIKNPRQNWWPKSWTNNQTLESAIKNSVVWYYQEVARQVGKKRMQEFIDKTNYGNKDISSPIDKFWLGASLRISPEEQVLFLQNLFSKKFKFAETNLKILKEILLWKKIGGVKIYAKTGSCDQGNALKGAWLVGFIESSNKTKTYFAYYTEHKSFQTASEKRNKHSLEYLKKYNLIP